MQDGVAKITWSFQGFRSYLTPSTTRQKAIQIYKDVAKGLLNEKKSWSLHRSSRPLLLTVSDVEAGDAFKAAGFLELEELKSGDYLESDCRGSFEKAYLAYVEVRPLEAATCLQQVIELWIQTDSYSTAALKSVALGDLYFNKLNDADKAIEAWQNAGDWYKHLQSIKYGPI